MAPDDPEAQPARSRTAASGADAATPRAARGRVSDRGKVVGLMRPRSTRARVATANVSRDFAVWSGAPTLDLPSAPHPANTVRMGWWADATASRSSCPRSSTSRRTSAIALAVILLHGIASSASTFELVVPRLRETHRVIAIELLGFGDSPAPPDADYTIDEHVAAIAATIRSLRLRGPFTLVGHSLGSLLGPLRRAAPARGDPPRAREPRSTRPDEIGDPLVRGHVSAYLRAYEFLRGNKDFHDRHRRPGGQAVPARHHVIDHRDELARIHAGALQHRIQSQTTISDIVNVSGAPSTSSTARCSTSSSPRHARDRRPDRATSRCTESPANDHVDAGSPTRSWRSAHRRRSGDRLPAASACSAGRASMRRNCDSRPTSRRWARLEPPRPAALSTRIA